MPNNATFSDSAKASSNGKWWLSIDGGSWGNLESVGEAFAGDVNLGSPGFLTTCKSGNDRVAYLKIEVGAEAGRRYELNRDEAMIGRQADCDIALTEEGRVSRQHAQVDIVFGFHHDAPAAKRSVSGTLDLLPADDASQSPSAILVDEGPDPSTSPILSKVDVSASSSGTLQLTASIESRLSALIEITRNLGRALALDEVLPQVLNSLFRIFLQADRGFIVLESDDGSLIPRWTKARKGGDEAIRISRTVVRQVMESKQAVLSEDATSEWTDISQSIADLRIRSMMCAPLLDSEGNSLGVIQLDTLDQRKQFRKDDLEVLASVAVQAGIAIHNAQLHEGALRQKDLQQDLELAREVQKAFLPQGPPLLNGYRFVAFYSPANHVGGDYYDYIALPDGRIAILVADVVGHGVAAAMMMAKVSAEAKYCLASESHPATAMSKLNDRITMLHIDRFVTIIMVVLDHQKHEATIVNAGHMAPIWRRADGSIAEPGNDLAGLPIGIVEDFDFDQATVQLQPGDMLFMYTDGVNEAMNVESKQYTIGRLRDKVAGTYPDLEALRQFLTDDLREFTGGGPQDDDICFVCVQYSG